MRRVVIVGRGMAGTRMVSELRALDDTLDITVFGAEPHPPYNRILLTNVLAGKTGEQDIALVDEVDGVDVRTGSTVTAIDRERRVVHASDGSEVGYDVLVLATGSAPFVPPVKGLVHDDGGLADGAAVLRTLDDCRRIQRLAGTADRALVLGGGPLGLEAAGGLASCGLEVEVLQAGDRLMQRQLDAEASLVLSDTLADAGVTVRPDSAVTEIIGRPTVRGVRLAEGPSIFGDLLVVACGTRPETGLAEAAGLPVGRGILVDDQMRTADPAIFAVGDCIEHEKSVHGLVAAAWDQVRVAAQVITATAPDLRYAGSAAVTRLKAPGVDLATMGESRLEDDGSDGTAETLRFVDSGRRTYQKVVIRDGRLTGAILLGDNTTAGTVIQLFARQDQVPGDRRALLFPEVSVGGSGNGKGSASSLPGSATVCQCNAVSKDTIVEAANGGAATLDEVADRTRATTGCGSCRKMVAELLDSAD